MARSKKKTTRRKKSSESSASRNAWGAGFIAGGLLLLLSLSSYHHKDLHGIWFFEQFAEGDPASSRRNLIGPIGAILGCIQFQFLGAAAWFLPLGLIWLGVRRIFLEGQFGWRTWAGFGVLLASSASLAGRPRLLGNLGRQQRHS